MSQKRGFDSILEEGPKLLMWYDQAVTKTGGE